MTHHSFPHRFRRVAAVTAASLAALAVTAPVAAASAAPAASTGALAPMTAPVVDRELWPALEWFDEFEEHDTLEDGAVHVWRVDARAGMPASIRVQTDTGHVVMSLVSPSGAELTPGAVVEYDGVLPEDGEYQLVLTNVGAFDEDYDLSATIEGHWLHRHSTRLNIPPGGTFADLEGELYAEGLSVWVVEAAAGQVLSLSTSESDVGWSVYGPDFILIHSGSAAGQLDVPVFADGDHWVTIWWDGDQYPEHTPQYAARLELTTSSVADGAARLLFPYGEETATAGGQLDDGWDVWVFTGAQDLMVLIESFDDPVYWELLSPTGDVLTSSNEVGLVSAVQLTATADYTLIVNHPSSMIAWDGPASYTIEVSMPGLHATAAAGELDLSSAQRFQMARRTHVGDIAGSLFGADSELWVMGVAAGQTISIEQHGDAVGWQLLTSLADVIASGAGNGEAYVYDSGDYYLRVHTTAGSGQNDYLLRITIPPL